MNNAIQNRMLILSRVLSLPLKLVPDVVHSTLFAGVMNRVMAEPLREGELDFIEQRMVSVRIRDINMALGFRLQHRRFSVCREKVPELVISGTFYDLLALATRKEDSDTLFFQRRLCLEGDTELGLQLKNFLDGLDIESLGVPPHLQRVISRMFKE